MERIEETRGNRGNPNMEVPVGRNQKRELRVVVSEIKSSESMALKTRSEERRATYEE